MIGRIIKGIAGFYFVETDNEKFECKARGLFRLNEQTPLVGDIVEFDAKNGKGFITNILARKNELIRPAAANIDMLIIVFAACYPKPDLALVDKLILYAKIAKIETVICINKCDELLPEEIEPFIAEYENTCKVFVTSTVDNVGIDELKGVIDGKISCFAGQSAVGKSSLINILCGTDLVVGGLSKKNDTGKHTTRHTQLLPMNSGYVLDTPGFSLFEIDYVEPEIVAHYYDEMKPYADKCRFALCVHINEPDCAVKDAVESGAIPKQRYERYKAIVNEFILKRKNKYD